MLIPISTSAIISTIFRGYFACSSFFFFCNDPATPEIYTLSLHDALPISRDEREQAVVRIDPEVGRREAEPFDLIVRDPRGLPAGRHGALTDLRDPHPSRRQQRHLAARSEEHTSELQSRLHLVCRLLLEKK